MSGAGRNTYTEADVAALVEAARRFCSMAPPWGHVDRFVRLEALRAALAPFGGWIQRAAAEPEAKAEPAGTWRCSCMRGQFDEVLRWDPMCVLHGEAMP